MMCKYFQSNDDPRIITMAEYEADELKRGLRHISGVYFLCAANLFATLIQIGISIMMLRH